MGFYFLVFLEFFGICLFGWLVLGGQGFFNLVLLGFIWVGFFLFVCCCCFGVLGGLFVGFWGGVGFCEVFLENVLFGKIFVCKL